jgi:hypothetical protein
MASNIALTNTNGFTSNLLTTTNPIGSSGSGGGPVTSSVNGGNNSKIRICFGLLLFFYLSSLKLFVNLSIFILKKN